MLLVDWSKKWRAFRERRRSRRPRHAGRRPFHFAAECLEARTLLSNVAVAVTNGVISLTGDSGNHTVNAAVVNLPSGNTTVPNLELTGTGNTTFSFGNQTNVTTLDIPLSQIGTIHGLTITMLGGDDAITFDATNLGTISGPVSVNLGDGTNSFTFDNATVTGTMGVTGGSGVDTISMTGDDLHTLGISTLGGDDKVTLSNDTIDGTTEPPADTSLQDFAQNLVSNVEAFVANFVGGFLGRLGSQLPGPYGNYLTGLGQTIIGRYGNNGATTNSRTALNIQTGDGNDTVDLENVTGSPGSDSTTDPTATPFGGFSWLFSDNAWHFGRQWNISLGAGNDTATINGSQLAQSLKVAGGSGNDTLNLTDTTIGGTTNVDMGSGQDQINVKTSTFTGRTSLSTGLGDSQTIAIDDSTFEAKTQITDPGSSANVNVETQGNPGSGTTFQGPVTISLPGPSATATLGSSSPDDSLTFDGPVFVFGGIPPATVAIDPSVSIDDNQLFLFSANRT